MKTHHCGNRSWSNATYSIQPFHGFFLFTPYIFFSSMFSFLFASSFSFFVRLQNNQHTLHIKNFIYRFSPSVYVSMFGLQSARLLIAIITECGFLFCCFIYYAFIYLIFQNRGKKAEAKHRKKN